MGGVKGIHFWKGLLIGIPKTSKLGSQVLCENPWEALLQVRFEAILES